MALHLTLPWVLGIWAQILFYIAHLGTSSSTDSAVISTLNFEQQDQCVDIIVYWCQIFMSPILRVKTNSYQNVYWGSLCLCLNGQKYLKDLYLCSNGQRTALLAPVEDLQLSGESPNCDSYALSLPSEKPRTKKSFVLLCGHWSIGKAFSRRKQL